VSGGSKLTDEDPPGDGSGPFGVLDGLTAEDDEPATNPPSDPPGGVGSLPTDPTRLVLYDDGVHSDVAAALTVARLIGATITALPLESGEPGSWWLLQWPRELMSNAAVLEGFDVYVSRVLLGDADTDLAIAPQVYVGLDPALSIEDRLRVMEMVAPGMRVLDHDVAGLPGVILVETGAASSEAVLDAVRALTERADTGIEFAEPDLVWLPTLATRQSPGADDAVALEHDAVIPGVLQLPRSRLTADGTSAGRLLWLLEDLHAAPAASVHLTATTSHLCVDSRVARLAYARSRDFGIVHLATAGHGGAKLPAALPVVHAIGTLPDLTANLDTPAIIDFVARGATSESAVLNAAEVAIGLWRQRPSMGADGLDEALRICAVDLGAPGHDPVYGWGLLEPCELERSPDGLDDLIRLIDALGSRDAAADRTADGVIDGADVIDLIKHFTPARSDG